MNRINQLDTHFTTPKKLQQIGNQVLSAVSGPDKEKEVQFDVWGQLGCDQYIRPHIAQLRKEMMPRYKEFEVMFNPYVEKGEFPPDFIEKFRKLPIQGCISGEEGAKYGGIGCNLLEGYAICFDAGKFQVNLTTFMGVHWALGTETIAHCGNDEQKARMLPALIKTEKIAAFALSEPNHGSDASSLKTSAVRATDGRDGWILNGVKRWPGLANIADYIVVWAVNSEEKNKIQGFVVERGSPGMKIEKIKGKLSLRIIENCDVTLDNVFVPSHNKLAKATNFEKSCAPVLAKSRLAVAWQNCGLGAGAYEAALKYCLERKQFGKPIAQFQIVQEKLSRMLANVEFSVSLLIHLSQQMMLGKCTLGQCARAKAHCSKLSRETVALGRECLGGNGILIENRLMRHFMDQEAIYTYEGTYDILSLISGREITGGLAAFK